MMDNLRTAANNIVLKIILALIILSFLLTGVGGYLIGDSNEYAAKVNGQKISRAQLEQALQGERARLQQQFGEQFPVLASNESYMQQVRQQILRQLINNMLLDQYSQKLGLTVSDEQVKESIRQTPYFHTDNKFDNAKYLDLITQMGYTPDQFAQLQRQQLINQQLLQAFGDSGFILPVEAQTMSELILQQRDVRLATLDLKALQTQQKVTDAELKTYYEQHKKSFLSPEEVKVSFITMDAAAMQDSTHVSEEDIQAYYEQNISQYMQPERKNFSVIQFKTETEAQSALDELKKGADFATLAQEKSTDIISRKNGGELGWLEPDTTADELKQAHLTMKGQLSGVIKSSVGYLIVRLNDIKPVQTKPLTELHDELAKKIKQEKAIDAYYALQQKVSKAATSDNESLASAEEAAGSKAQQTGWFTRATIPAQLNFPPLIQAIFGGSLNGTNGAPGSNSDVITVEGDRAFVIRVDGYKPENIQPFEQVRNQVIELVKRHKAEQQGRIEGEKILAALKQGSGTEAMKTAGLDFGEKKTLSRASDDDQLAKAIFSLAHPEKNKPVYGLSQDRQDNTVLIELLSVIPGKLSKDDMKTFVNQMQEGGSGVVFEALMANLHKQAKIKIGSFEQQLQ